MTAESTSPGWPAYYQPLFTFFDLMPVAVLVWDIAGNLVTMNPKAEETWKVQREQIIGTFNILQQPQAIEQGTPAYFQRATQGEVIQAEPVVYTTSQGIRNWMMDMYFPLRDANDTIQYIVVISRNMTETMEQQQRLEQTRQELEAQRETVLELSSPVIQIWEGILTLPLVGPIDARRATLVTENLLEAIVQYQADTVLIDVTGVAGFDEQVASYLLSAIKACHLLGSEAALVGISGEAARTLVQIDVDLGEVVTYANLQAGLAWAFDRQNLEVRTRRGVLA